MDTEPGHFGSSYLTVNDLPSYQALADRMNAYRVDRLAGMSEKELREAIGRMEQEVRPDFEHYTDAAVQRTQSVKFVWGHDHDFGTFQKRGQMANRHVKHMAVFKDHFGQSPEALEGRRVLEIGCWTGGVTLMLAAMGAHVHAIEEVRKYVETVELLKRAFGLERVTVENKSLYSLTGPEYQDSFDCVVFAGVVYHLTDPIVAMRILFNTLKDGCWCWVESTGVRAPVPVFGYQRGGWNWFHPSPQALKLLMEDVGFRNVRVGPVTPGNRLYAVGQRERHVDMRRDGLSVPTLR